MSTYAKSAAVDIQNSTASSRHTGRSHLSLKNIAGHLPALTLMIVFALIGVFINPVTPVLSFIGGAFLAGIAYYLIDGVRTRYPGAGSDAID